MKKTPLRRKSKTPLAKAKATLWAECRRIQFEKYGDVCYTCGKQPLEGSNRQLGHFISSSICSAFMRYHLPNLRPQCFRCNINLSGNWVAFEENLQKEGIDTDALKQLNRDTTGEKYDLEWYNNKIAEYMKL